MHRAHESEGHARITGLGRCCGGTDTAWSWMGVAWSWMGVAGKGTGSACKGTSIAATAPARFAGPPHVENNGDGAAATDAHHNDECNDHKEQDGCRGIGRFAASRAVGEGDGSALGIAVGEDNGSMLGIAVGEGYVQGGRGESAREGKASGGCPRRSRLLAPLDWGSRVRWRPFRYSDKTTRCKRWMLRQYST